MGEQSVDGTSIDGRRARRERGRVAVIDAMFELLQEGKVPPAVELIADRSGVSVASIFRYFQGIDDLQFQTYQRFRERFEPLVRIGVDGDLTARTNALVQSRLDLYEQAGAIMAVGRLRALEHQPLVEASAQMRGVLADQVRTTFAHETAGSSPARAADLVAVIDALTSLESWDVMRKTHARSRSQIARAWAQGIRALVGSWNQPEQQGS
ncbi:MAG TPA: TetR/AcrR family transcriptional regulator [Ilumatobacteraceae bacterium]|nr:TetR/AcrR family transcriptional regulator [Ilumatobacteraceae bacterium]